MLYHVAVSLLCLAALCFPVLSSAAPEPTYTYTLRISTENPASHTQTLAVQRFIAELQQRAGNRIEVEYYHSAKLFRDRDVLSALSTGKVNMAVPGMWQLDRYVADVGIYMLPIFYGLDVDQHYAVRDGQVGQAVNRAIEQDLNLKVLGRWIDLGYAHLYFTQNPVREATDLKGKRVRIPGGIANKSRLQAFGTEPKIIAWPDLADALAKQEVEAVLTSYETIRSAALWEQGIRYAFEDREYFPQYVPLLARDFWQKLPADLQQAMLSSWEAIVDQARQDAAQAQDQAKQQLMDQGVEIIVPSPATTLELRNRAIKVMPELIKNIGLDQRLLQQTLEAMQP